MLPTRPTSNWLESNSPSLHQTQDGSVDPDHGCRAQWRPATAGSRSTLVSNVPPAMAPWEWRSTSLSCDDRDHVNPQRARADLGMDRPDRLAFTAVRAIETASVRREGVAEV